MNNVVPTVYIEITTKNSKFSKQIFIYWPDNFIKKKKK